LEAVALLDDLHLRFIHPPAMHLEFGQSTVDLRQLAGCQNQAGGFDILVKVRDLSGARNRNDEGLLSQ